MAAGVTYDPIATTTLGSAAASITFSSISSAYTDLRLVLTATTSFADWSYLRFNGDGSTTLYSQTRLYGNGTSAASATNSNYNRVLLGDTILGIGTSTTIPTLSTMDIFSYAGSTYKTSLITISGDQNGTGYTYRNVCLYSSTSPITSFVIANGSGSNFNAGTTATLYGILKA